MAAPSSSRKGQGKGSATWRHIGLYGHSVGTFTVDLSSIIWKSPTLDDNSMSTVKVLPADSLKMAYWTVFGRSGHLRITTSRPKSGSSSTPTSKTIEYRFDGFPPSDFEKMSNILQKLYNLKLMKHTMSSSGYSFGKADISGNHLVYRKCIVDDEEEEGQDGDEMLSLNLAEVSQCVLPGNNRNEIELQFHESDTVEQGSDQCVQIRFYVPPENDADPDAPTNAELFQQRIMTKAHIKNTTGSIIAEFDENMGTFLTPRGRYAIELYDSFLRMRGTKYDYKIKYDDISRLFLLPKPGDVHMAFVIALDKPIRQGQQRYQYLVLQTNKDPASVSISLDEETLQKEYNGALQPVMTGALSNLIAKTFKIVTKKKVFVPGKFTNSNQQECVKCSLRAYDGHLYPLEKQLIFIHKPALLVRFEEVEHVEFQRYAGGQGSTRNFDLCVTLKSTSDDSLRQEYTFSGIDRTDYTPLHNFLAGKKIKIKNLQDPTQEPGPSIPEYNEDRIFGIGGDKNGRHADGGGEGEDSEEDESYKGGQDSSSEDLSSDEDDNSDVSEGTDSDLEEARKNAKKSKPKPKQTKIIQPKPKKTKRKADDEDSKTAASSTSKTAKRPKKDPNKPKGKSSAYMFFVKEARASIKAENPDATFGELSKIVAKKFKELDAEQRSKYEKLADKDKLRYDKEMENYTPQPDDEKSGKKKKDPNAPKKPLSAYNYFCAANRGKLLKKQPDASFSDLAKMNSRDYKALTSEEKKEYDKKAKADKQRYAMEMEKYNAKQKNNMKIVKKESESEESDSDSDSESDSDSD